MHQCSGPLVFESADRRLLSAVFHLVIGETEGEVTGTVMEKFEGLNISLTPEDKLLLKHRYQEGLPVTEAGGLLGLNRFQASGRMRRLMARLKTEFERVGLDRELRLLLE